MSPQNNIPTENCRNIHRMGKRFPMLRIVRESPCVEAVCLDFDNLKSRYSLAEEHSDARAGSSIWNDSCSKFNGDGPISQLGLSRRKEKVVTIRSGQKQFTEDEVSRLTGICLDHLRSWAQSRQLGSLIRAAEAASAGAEKWLFSDSDLMIVNVLCPRCEH